MKKLSNNLRLETLKDVITSQSKPNLFYIFKLNNQLDEVSYFEGADALMAKLIFNHKIIGSIKSFANAQYDFEGLDFESYLNQMFEILVNQKLITLEPFEEKNVVSPDTNVPRTMIHLKKPELLFMNLEDLDKGEELLTAYAACTASYACY